MLIPALISLPISEAYYITNFSDGGPDKILLFSSDIQEGTVLMSIPRATNLSEASLSLEGQNSNVSSEIRDDSLPGHDGDIELASKSDWWNTSWSYRARFSISVTKEYENIMIDTTQNLTNLTGQMGVSLHKKRPKPRKPKDMIPVTMPSSN